ncbi:PAS domain-containing protein [Sphingomonas sp. PB2P12]|uniref:PAS domain-containing protein n=1 Tax=Sphingomonas sandaracina TaxID=3096157 RepID=UPI002FCAAFB1
MVVGHSISSADGVILAIDEPVATMLQRHRDQLIGISYTSITHPDDLALNLTKIAALRPNGQSTRIRKRYIGGKGDIITMEVQVSRLAGSDGGQLVGTLSTVDDMTGHEMAPHRLWRRARDLIEIVRARDELLGADLFADHAWTILLQTYVAEAEGRIASTAMISDHLSLSSATISRWLRVLQSKTLLEPVLPGIDALQLTQTGIDRVERLLDQRLPEPVA